MTPYLNFLSQIVNQSIYICVLVGAAFALVAGLMLLIDSKRALRIAEHMDRWVSTRAALRPLEEHHSIARPLYRMHRLFGLLICAGALYALVILGMPGGGAAITSSLSTLGSAHFSAWVSESLRIILLAGYAARFVFGGMVLDRPSP